MMRFFIFLSIFGLIASECPGPIEPGMPGVAWSKEELEITRKKVLSEILIRSMNEADFDFL